MNRHISAIAFVLLSSLILVPAVVADQSGPEKKSLPVVITNVKRSSSDLAVVFVSGDGGWWRFEQAIADSFANAGIPTIGLDAKKYFWSRKTPDQTTRDVVSIIDTCNKKWNKDSLVLIGYSFGAEIVPFIVNRLPNDLRDKISMVILLSPGMTNDFEIHLMYGITNRDNVYDVPGEISRMKNVPVMVILGDQEKTKIPELLRSPDIRVVRIAGDHHYDNNINLIVKTMKITKHQ